jgi:hypothetical protein
MYCKILGEDVVNEMVKTKKNESSIVTGYTLPESDTILNDVNGYG